MNNLIGNNIFTGFILAMLLSMIIMLCCCNTTPVNYDLKPEACCIYEDGVRFIFCIDNRKLGIMITPVGVFFAGIEGKCECSVKGNEL